MEIKKILTYFTVFFLGITASDFLWHFRFMDNNLRRELIGLMQDGNGYFLIFAYFNLILTLIIAGITIFYNKKEWFKDHTQTLRKENK